MDNNIKKVSNVPRVGVFEHLNGPYHGAFERYFGPGRGEFEQ